MQIVIDIPEDRYDEIYSLKFVMYGLKSEENKQLFFRLLNAVRDGTPLPKGHGRLIDEDELDEYKQIMTTIFGESKFAVRMDDIRKAQTIIEADKVYNK